MQNDLFKLLAIAIGVVILALVVLVVIVKKSTKPKLPEARVHHDDSTKS